MIYRTMGGCPVCGKRFEDERRRGYTFRRCTGCMGIWMPIDVLELMLRDMLPADQAWTRWPELEDFDVADARACPDCHTPMVRAMMLEVAVDMCRAKRHGVYLDMGELQPILHRMALEGPPPKDELVTLEQMLVELGIATEV